MADAPPPVSFRTVPPDSPQARRVVERYFAELSDRFEGGFDVEAYTGGSPVSRPDAAGDGAGGDSAGGLLLLGTRAGDPVACGALQPIGPGIAELKRMWVDPELRGQGVGRMLLAHLESLARKRGDRVVRLDTNKTLNEAIAMYERAGYRRIPRYNQNPYAHVWFEKQLG